MRASSLFFVFSFLGAAAAVQPSKVHASWALMYYMPYDNNLSPYADSVQSMVQAAIEEAPAVVTFLRDDARQSGIRHMLIGQGVMRGQAISSEASSGTRALENYLGWIHDNIQADHYAFIFLDHGGKATELCLDEFPVRKFLTVDSIREVLQRFTTQIGKPLDLLFLQVCAKGSIEPLYELRQCADYTLASQPILGAPNYYYPALSALTSSHDAVTLAKMIADGEREDMFYSLTLIKNEALDRFKQEFDAFVGKIDSNVRLDPTKLKIVEYDQTSYWDVRSFLLSLSLPSALMDQRDDLLVQLNQVISFHQINKADQRMAGYCGISMLAPTKSNYSGDNLRFSFLKNSPLLKLQERMRARPQAPSPRP